LVCETQDGMEIMRLYVAFFLFEDFSEEKKLPKCIGIRFEAPEGPGGGHHDYYHAQFIRRFGERDELDLTWYELVPDSQPAIPLPAKCRVTLLLSAVIAIYGLKFFNSTVADAFQGNKVLIDRVRDWLPNVG